MTVATSTKDAHAMVMRSGSYQPSARADAAPLLCEVV